MSGGAGDGTRKPGGGAGRTAGGGRGGARRFLSSWRLTRFAGEYACIDRRIGDELPLLHAGLLDAERAAVVEAHVGACHACEGIREGLRAVAEVVDVLAAEEREHAAPDGDGLARGRRSLAPPLPAVVAIAGAVTALVLVVAWQRARDAALVAEIRGLRAEIGRVERGAASAVARIAQEAGGQPMIAGDGQPVIPIAGVRFPSPPNF
jgi:anti-sigma factor RsiW